MYVKLKYDIYFCKTGDERRKKFAMNSSPTTMTIDSSIIQQQNQVKLFPISFLIFMFSLSLK